MVFKNQIWQPVISFEARSICAWECLLPFSPVSMFLTARWLKTSCQEEGKKIVFKANLAFSIFTMWQMISVADISLRLVLSLLVLFVQLWGCDCIIDVSYGSGLKRKEWSLRKVQTYLQIYLFTQKIDTMIKKMFWSCVSVVKEKCYAFSYLCQLQSNFNESRLKYKQITQSLQCNGIKTRIQQSTKNVAKKETKWMNTWHA